MIRVGFILNFHHNEWLGGINYYRNLIGAILANPNRNIEPVIFLGYDTDTKFLEGFPTTQIIKDHILDLDHPKVRIRYTLKRWMNRDVVLERLLKKNKISVLSHFGSLGTGSSFPTIGWIPDFQYKYSPDFFSKAELSTRDRNFHEICAECTRVIFSSNTAKKDADYFFPDYSKKYRVLHFVTGNIDFFNLPDFLSLTVKYHIDGPYFIVPNQFWVHKNHMVIIEALKILQSHHNPVTVIATGNTSDYRQPEYFKLIQNKIQDNNLSDFFNIVGVVPYKDLLQLMMHAVAVINPSLFEGWSTSVEESKALNLKIILSDIPVHREQNPPRGFFFPPHDAELLATILLSSLPGEITDYSKDQLYYIAGKLNEQQIIFAENYELIVQDTLLGIFH